MESLHAVVKDGHDSRLRCLWLSFHDRRMGKVTSAQGMVENDDGEF